MEQATLGPETTHRAYRRAKAEYQITYDEVAEQITKLGYPVSQQTIFRLEDQDAPPKQARRQILTWMFMLAIGYDPSTIPGLKKPMAGMIDWDKAASELHPGRWKRSVATNHVRSRCDSSLRTGTSPVRGSAA